MVLRAPAILTQPHQRPKTTINFHRLSRNFLTFSITWEKKMRQKFFLTPGKLSSFTACENNKPQFLCHFLCFYRCRWWGKNSWHLLNGKTCYCCFFPCRICSLRFQATFSLNETQNWTIAIAAIDLWFMAFLESF
jgi:hypothetical protein